MELDEKKLKSLNKLIQRMVRDIDVSFYEVYFAGVKKDFEDINKLESFVTEHVAYLATIMVNIISLAEHGFSRYGLTEEHIRNFYFNSLINYLTDFRESLIDKKEDTKH